MCTFSVCKQIKEFPDTSDTSALIKPNQKLISTKRTGAEGAVTMSSANRLVGTGFVSQYQLHWVGVRPLHPHLSH